MLKGVVVFSGHPFESYVSAAHVTLDRVADALAEAGLWVWSTAIDYEEIVPEWQESGARD